MKCRIICVCLMEWMYSSSYKLFIQNTSTRQHEKSERQKSNLLVGAYCMCVCQQRPRTDTEMKHTHKKTQQQQQRATRTQTNITCQTNSLSLCMTYSRCTIPKLKMNGWTCNNMWSESILQHHRSTFGWWALCISILERGTKIPRKLSTAYSQRMRILDMEKSSHHQTIQPTNKKKH